jgi:hypothetical protein
MADSTQSADAYRPWQELIAQQTHAANEGLASMVRDIPVFLKELPPGESMLNGFEGLEEILAQAATILGPQPCQAAVAAIAPFVPSAIAELKHRLDTPQIMLAVKFLSYLNTARCCGESLPAEAVENEGHWFARIASKPADLDESVRQTLAFAALALGETSFVPGLIDSGPLAKRFVPGKSFQSNTQGFIRYLALAIDKKAKAEDIAPAWNDFVTHFPMKLSAETLTWPDLLWCARAVGVHFEGRPVETAAEAVHEMVT